MRNTILPPEGFDPVALDDKDLRVSVRPGRAINSVKVELSGRTPDGRTWTGSTTFSRGTDAVPFEAARSVASMVGEARHGYAELADERIHSAVSHFVATHPGIFWERWELQAFAKAKAILAVEAAAWADVLDGKALPEEAKRDVSQPWEGTFCIPSRSRWQVWTLPDDSERPEWDKAGVLSLGLESVFSARGTAPAVAFLSSVRDVRLADALRAAHGDGISAPDGRILFEYRSSGAVTLATPEGPVVPREDLMPALSELGRGSAWTFFENCHDTVEDIARDVRGGIESLDAELSPMVADAVRSSNRAVRKVANAVGLEPGFHEHRSYAPASLPETRPDDMHSLAHALDAAGAHRFAEFVMDHADDGLDGIEAVERELARATIPGVDILESPRNRLRDVPNPAGEAEITGFARASLDACRAALEAAPRP